MIMVMVIMRMRVGLIVRMRVVVAVRMSMIVIVTVPLFQTQHLFPKAAKLTVHRVCIPAFKSLKDAF